MEPQDFLADILRNIGPAYRKDRVQLRQIPRAGISLHEINGLQRICGREFVPGVVLKSLTQPSRLPTQRLRRRLVESPSILHCEPTHLAEAVPESHIGHMGLGGIGCEKCAVGRLEAALLQEAHRA